MRNWLVVSFAVLTALALTGFSSGRKDKFRADLEGYQETPATLSSPASGEFEARLDENTQTIEFELTYTGFETAVNAAHIHLGRPGTTGGVIAFLCGGGGKPACDQGSGSVSGTIAPADVIGPVAQGIAAGEFEELVRALRANATYVNVHSVQFPSGEIRGAVED